ncbi:hypothetical protein CTA1_9431 [Colletotrichum tanaceti]|uniref:Uncharacterized protein n=1 Tax=Colletotrichum tanaceti TaxID=1306861 RepID=A0A4U6XI71_9PEZI|nr:hypothetical protein CTA1_9431 [Colletotrichum tanaceti]
MRGYAAFKPKATVIGYLFYKEIVYNVVKIMYRLKQTPYAKAVSLAFAEETYRQLLIITLSLLSIALKQGVPVYWVVDLDLAVTDPSAAQAESLVQRFRKLHLHKTSGTNEP